MKRTKKLKSIKLLQRNLAFLLAVVLLALVAVPSGTVRATGETTTADEENQNEGNNTSLSEYETLMKELDTLADEAKMLFENSDTDAKAIDDFYNEKLMVVMEAAQEKFENDLITSEEMNILNAKGKEIAEYLESGTENESQNTPANLAESTSSRSAVSEEGLNIHLFDYGSGVIDKEYNDKGQQIFPLIAMGCGNLYDTSIANVVAMYLDVIPSGFVTVPTKTGGLSSYLGSDDYPFFNLKDLGGKYTASLKKYFDKDQQETSKRPNDSSFFEIRDYNEKKYRTTNYDVLHYPVSGGLYSKEGNYFIYDSRNNHAYYDYSTKKLNVEEYALRPGFNVDGRYTQIGHFLPFSGRRTDYTSNEVSLVTKAEATYKNTSAESNGYPSNINYYETSKDLYSVNIDWSTLGQSQSYDQVKNRLNMFLGMSTDFTFYQPANGKLETSNGNTEDMVFEFSGDDLMYVYLDGVKVIDLDWAKGVGLGGAKYATINFNTGVVRVYMVDCSPEEHGTNPNYYYETTLRQCFETALKDAKADNVDLNFEISDYFEEGSNTFKDYTALDFDMFYMDTGASTSNCFLRFNMDPVPEGSVNLEKKVTAYDESLINPDETFEFEILAEHSQDELNIEVGEEISYILYDIATGNETTGTVQNGNGDTFELKANQRAFFDLPSGTKVTFKENLTNTTQPYAESWTLNGNAATINPDESVSTTVNATGGTQNFICTNTLCSVINDKVVSKPNADGVYKLTLDAFTTGSANVQAQVKPADIVMVLDQSGSMYYRTGDAFEANEITSEKASQFAYYVVHTPSGTGANDDYSQYEFHYLEYDSGKWNIYHSDVENDIIYDWYTPAASGSRIIKVEKGLSELPSYISDPSISDVYKTRYGAMYDATTNFVDNLHSSGVNHRISIVGFAGNENRNGEPYPSQLKYKNGNFLFDGANYYRYDSDSGENKAISSSQYASSLKDVNTDAGYTDLKASLSAVYTNYEKTCQAAGLDMAYHVFENAPETPEERDKIVILFSDGGTSTTIDHLGGTNMDDDSILYASYLKNNSANGRTAIGAEVYSVAYSFSHNMLNFTSSNYPDATSMNNGTSDSDGDKDGKYYLTANTPEGLNNIFNTVLNNISGTEVSLDTSAVIRDVIADGFKLSGDISSIKVFTEDYNGTSFENKTDITNKVTITVNDKTIDVSGFDYKNNCVIKGVEGGKKLIVEIPIIRDESNQGGNHQDTNKETSGIYSNGQIVELYPIPHVDEPTSITLKKEVIGLDSDKETEFSFNVQYKAVDYGNSYELVSDDSAENASNYAKIDTSKLTNETKTVSLNGTTITEQSQITFDDIYVGIDEDHANNIVIKEIIPNDVSSDYRLLGIKDTENPGTAYTPDSNGNITVPVSEGKNLNLTIVYTNEKLNDLTVTKKVTGNMGDRNKKFDFAISIKDRDGNAYTEEITGMTKSTEKDGLYTFQLANEESVDVTLPYGYTYQIVENSYNTEGYSTTVVSGNSDDQINNLKISGSLTTDNTVLYTNDKNVATPTGINTKPLLPALICLWFGLVAVAVKMYLNYKRRAKLIRR